MGIRTKIPSKYHQQLFDWYTNGLSISGCLNKLENELNYKTSRRTLTRLLQNMKAEKHEIIQATIAHKAQEQVVGDFDKLNKLYDDVEVVAQFAKNNDYNLHLRAVDRLVKLLQIKFGITLKEDKSQKEEIDRDSVLDSLMEKLGK